MLAKQTITIKSQGDSINIILDADADFKTITDNLRKKVSDAKQFFEGATANVAFKGRKLTKSEERHLLDIITTETTMSVTLVDGDVLQPAPPPLRAIKKSVSKPEPVLESIPEPKIVATAPPNINYIEHNTAYYHGGLRSGQSIKFNGSVVVIGDVNPGSEVVADGNVIVLGGLRGMAHAGASGDDTCFVSALTMQPTQLRIADLITHVPASTLPRGKKEPHKASVAYVKDRKVFIGTL